MVELSDYVAFAKSHRRDSAKFLTKFDGKDIYAGIYLRKVPRFLGYPLLMKESRNKVIPLTYDEITAVLASMPDED